MLSVIMSVYNAEDYLEESIKSILNQSYADFEFIIIDDKSNDNSRNIIQNYSIIDNRIKFLVNKENRGLTYSLNKALAISEGKYIARMDADDIAHPKRLEKQISYLSENKNVSLIGTQAYNINENGEIISKRNVPLSNKKIKETIILVNPIIHPSVMFRKRDIIKIDGYNEEFKKVQDYELWFKCIANNLKVVNLSERLLYYRVNEEYFERKSFQYRITEVKVRWRGYNMLSIPYYKRYGIFIPFVLGLIPNFILEKIYNLLKKYDPRKNQIED